MKHPQVSVVLSVHNRERFVAAAIESILRQTFTEFEFIIIDDGSTDRSPEILRSFAARDARVRLVQQENAGLGAALNHGIDLARGTYIARMDDDDIALSTRFETQLAFLDNNPECVAVGTNVSYIDEDGWLIGHTSQLADHDAIDNELLGGRGGAILHPSVIMKKRSILDAGGYREEFRRGQDLDLFLRLAEIGRLANVAEELLQFRLHAGGRGSVTPDEARKRLNWRRQIVEDAMKRRGCFAENVDVSRFWEARHPGRFHAGMCQAARRNGYYLASAKHCAYALWLDPMSAPTLRAVANQIPLLATAARSVRTMRRHLQRGST